MELILPEEKYLDSYKEAYGEYQKHQVTQYQFLNAQEKDIFTMIKNYREGVGLPEGFVPSTYLWLVRNGEFIGEASIRHRLTDSLLRFGGHIGYGIRYRSQKQGYGTILLQKTVAYASAVLGLKEVLITCSDTNTGSYKVIEHNGGILQDKIINVIDGKERLTRRYRIITN